MANISFRGNVPHVAAGSPVSASNTGAATRSLEQRTNQLRQALAASSLGEYLALRDAAVSADSVVNDVLYFDPDTGQFSPALSATTTVGGQLAAAPSAMVAGLLVEKSSPEVGVVVVLGAVSLAGLADESGDALVAGWYYLSSTAPGKVTRVGSGVPTLFVLYPAGGCYDTSLVLFRPQNWINAEAHVHFQFDLVTRPAGIHVPPTVGEPHEITAADATLPGWLPADHESFGGNAPAGAAFGYNLSADASLSQAWPPIPLGTAFIECKPGATLLTPGRLETTHVRFDAYGIWWMTDCYGQVPWEPTLDTTASASSSSAGDSCPDEDPLSLRLYFLKMSFQTNRTVVTSLAPDDDQPITFVNCDGEPASTGDLKARVDFGLTASEDEQYGGLVVKTLDGVTVGYGHVLEGIVLLSPRLTASATRYRRLTPDDTDTPLVYQGIVSLDLEEDGIDRELVASVIQLGDATQYARNGIPYTGFPTGRDSNIVLRIDVPATGLPTNPTLKLRTLLFGLIDGTLTALSASYYRLPRPDTPGSTAISGSYTALTFDSDIAVTADAAIEVESSEFSVEAGDTVFIELSREAAGSPVYGAEIGLIRASGILSPSV